MNLRKLFGAVAASALLLAIPVPRGARRHLRARPRKPGLQRRHRRLDLEAATTDGLCVPVDPLPGHDQQLGRRRRRRQRLHPDRVRHAPHHGGRHLDRHLGEPVVRLQRQRRQGARDGARRPQHEDGRDAAARRLADELGDLPRGPRRPGALRRPWRPTPTTAIASDHGWVAIQSASVNPACSSWVTTTRSGSPRRSTRRPPLVANGEVGYDNVRLTTAAADGSGNGGSGVTEIKQLRKLVKSYILPSSMSVQGRFLVVTAPLPGRSRPRGPARSSSRVCRRASSPRPPRPARSPRSGPARTGPSRSGSSRRTSRSYTSAKKVWVKIHRACGQGARHRPQADQARRVTRTRSTCARS